MPDKVILVRGDGSKLEATPEQAQRLAILGYQQESSDQHIKDVQAGAEREYYESSSQRLRAAGEAVGAGLSFGATDFFGDREATAKRAEYNPGTRIAGEILGAVAPLVLSGGKSAEASAAQIGERAGLVGSGRLATGTGAARIAEGTGAVNTVAKEASALSKVASKAPTSLLSDAARALAPGAEGSLTKAISAGVLEGSVYGIAGEIDHSYLDGTPLTSEAVLHGVGWGAFLGGALAGVGHGISKLGEEAQAAIDKPAIEAAKHAEATKVVDTKNKLSLAKHADEVEAVRAENAAKKAEYAQAVKDADAAEVARVAKAKEPPVPKGALQGTAGAEYQAFKGETRNLVNSFKQAVNDVDTNIVGAFEQAKGSVHARNLPMIDQGISESRVLFQKAVKAAESGKFEAAQEAIGEYASKTREIGKIIGADIPSPVKPFNDFIAMKAVGAELQRLPGSVEAFATMSPASFERIAGAIEKMGTLGVSGTEIVKEASLNFSRALGIEAEDLRGAWRAAKEILKNEGKPGVVNMAERIKPPDRPGLIKEPNQPKLERFPRPPSKEADKIEGLSEGGRPSFLRHLLGYAVGGKAYVTARAAGLGRVGGYAAYRGVRDAVVNGTKHLSEVRAAAISKVRDATAAFAPGTGRAIRYSAGSAASGLGTTLYGEKDTSTKDPQQLALNRIKEINEFAPTARNSLFKVVEPLSTVQPELAKGIHASGLEAFQALYELTPKDPGAISKLKGIWKPSDVAALTLSKQLAVFHAPLKEAVEMLNTSNFDPIKCEALRKFAPAVWQEMRVGVLDRVSQPGVMDKMTYQDQIGLSVMLDLPIHSSMEPGYIATSQQLFVDRNQPLTANPRIGQNGGAPNPADNANATSAQKTESH